MHIRKVGGIEAVPQPPRVVDVGRDIDCCIGKSWLRAWADWGHGLGFLGGYPGLENEYAATYACGVR